ncbi:MAG: hypothetical protein IJ559_07530 [Prevotella sp.]|nr:hypothetical protein [Prevotella sp.]
MNKTDDILNRLQQAQQPSLDNPDELTERIMSRLPDRGRPRPQTGARRAWRYVAVGIAASVLLLIGVGVATQRQESHPTELIADNAEKGNHLVESVLTDTEKRKHPVESVPNDAAKEDAPAKSIPCETEKEDVPSVKVLDANLHYAAYTETKDTSDYLPPARVDEFVEKLAAYHHVEATVLSDSTAHSVAYVFPDNDKVRLFDRLLQVACTYSYDSPGYQMTISQQQLLFTLEDTRLNRRYLWLAERIGGSRIILYATHAPTGAAVSSEAYQEFRERTTHTNQTTEL